MSAFLRHAAHRTAAGLIVLPLLAACSTATAPVAPWEARLQGDAIVLLGEVHDNPHQHRLRLELLRRAFAAGWRPAIAMEQLDRERQGDIERARAERPGDAQYLIERAAAPAARAGSGWNWDFYRPYIALALQYGVPLVAANLSSADAAKVARGGLDQVFDAAGLASLGLDRPIAPEWQAAQEREIDLGHCGALPREVWPRLARAQFARDAVMAQVLRRPQGRDHGSNGIVLLAGNGHVRRDIGVPRWLGSEQARIFVVGFLERGNEGAPAAAFDAVLVTEAAPRSDPCEGFKERPRGDGAAGRGP